MSDIVRQRSVPLRDFSGGLNNFWDPSSIADNEVPFLLNMEFTPNGALTSRPPIVDRGLGHPLGASSTEHIDLLGYYTPESGKIFLVASTSAKTWVIEIQEYGFGSWIEIWSSKATAFVQYANQIVMSRAATGGARWTEGDATFTAIATMPALFTLVLFKERMFGSGLHGTADETAIYWSDVISLDQPTGIYEWNSDSFVYVSRGDGQPITELIADYNGLIIFKRNATYNLVYSDLPEEGTVSLVQTNIGAQNKRSVVGYQNGFVVLHNRILYKFQNNVYAPINAQKVRFAYDENFDSATSLFSEAVSVIGDRALVFTAGNLYSLNLLTGTWSQWQTTTQLGYLIEVPRARGYQRRYPIAFGTGGVSATKLWYLQDFPVSGWFEESGGEVVTVNGSETFDCVMRTKIFDFDAPTEWKRIYWWSADVSAKGTVTGKIIPIGVPDIENTWDQLDQFTWDYLESLTWDTLFFRDVAVTTDQTVTGDGPQRVALKMDKSARFRRAFFELYLTCDGTEETAPAQIFSLTPMIGVKAKMSKDVA
jgi:hypothetical protein